MKRTVSTTGTVIWLLSTDDSVFHNRPSIPIEPTVFVVNDPPPIPHGWHLTYARGVMLPTYRLRQLRTKVAARCVRGRVYTQPPVIPSPEKQRQKTPRACALRARWKKLRRSA